MDHRLYPAQSDQRVTEDQRPITWHRLIAMPPERDSTKEIGHPLIWLWKQRYRRLTVEPVGVPDVILV